MEAAQRPPCRAWQGWGAGWTTLGSSAWQTPSNEAPLQTKQPELELWAQGMTQWGPAPGRCGGPEPQQRDSGPAGTRSGDPGI